MDIEVARKVLQHISELEWHIAAKLNNLKHMIYKMGEVKNALPLQPTPPAIPTPALVPVQPRLEVAHEAMFQVGLSSRNFFINSDFAQVEKFYIKLNMVYGHEIHFSEMKEDLMVAKVVVKQLVCVHCEKDKCFFRGQIQKVNDDGSCLVRFIDWGDLKTVKPDDIFVLHEEFCDEPAMAVQCYVDGKWDQKTVLFDTVMKQLSKFPESPMDLFDAARVTIHPSIDGVKYPVSVQVKTMVGQSWVNLLDVPLAENAEVSLEESIKQYIFNPKDFAETCLTEKNFDKSPKGYLKMIEALTGTATMLKLGKPDVRYSFRCTYVVSPDRIALACEGAAELVTNISFFYRDSPESAPTNYDFVEEGKLVIFAFDRYFFRGLVLSIDYLTKTLVYSVDLGFTAVLDNTSIFPLLSPTFSLESYQPKAVIVGLDKIAPLSGNEWSAVTAITLKSFAEDQMVVVLPSSYYSGTYLVEMILPTLLGGDERATDLLKKFKIAKEVFI